VTDKGWIFPDYETETLLGTESILQDFAFKDELNQNFIYSHTIYFGNKLEMYNRSYVKVQQIIASVGGFAKACHFILCCLYSYLGAYLKDIMIINKFDFEIEEKKQNLNFTVRRLKSSKMNFNNRILNENDKNYNNRLFNKNNNDYHEAREASGFYNCDLNFTQKKFLNLNSNNNSYNNSNINSYKHDNEISSSNKKIPLKSNRKNKINFNNSSKNDNLFQKLCINNNNITNNNTYNNNSPNVEIIAKEDNRFSIVKNLSSNSDQNLSCQENIRLKEKIPYNTPKLVSNNSIYIIHNNAERNNARRETTIKTYLKSTKNYSLFKLICLRKNSYDIKKTKIENRFIFKPKKKI